MKKSIHFTMDSYSEPEFGLFFFFPVLEKLCIELFFQFYFSTLL